jgi:site-specific DNA-methyltransferase (adenine-specific)
MGNRRKGTKTSAFGSPGRINHDSTPFYTSRLYEGLPKEEPVKYVENSVPPEFIDKIFCKSSEKMEELPDNSIHLMVTSPPYNVGKEYDENLTLNEYRAFLKKVWSEVKRVLVPGGRACINIANLGRKPYIPLHAFIVEDMIELGFLMRGEIIWNKASSSSPSTAWGSWLSAKNPILRDIHEYILVFSKGTFSRENLGRKSTISKEEFLEFTKSVWTFPAESATKVGHPAPFPVELPYRLIQLYTFEGEVVLDPFMGSGQTAIAAIKTRRHYVGYDINEEYVKLAEKRIKEFSLTYNAPKLYEFEKKKDKKWRNGI